MEEEEEHPKLSNGPVVSESLPGSHPSPPPHRADVQIPSQNVLVAPCPLL